MALSQSTLRSTLATILSVDPKYIVPKQGNWFNPQDMLPSEERPLTWIAYRISNAKPRMIPVLIEDTDGKRSINFIVSKVDLQIVGTRAEELSISTVHWLKRQDVITAFEAIGASLMAEDFSYYVLDFYQDGGNNILSYNVSFRVIWESVLEPEDSGDPLTTANISGVVKIPV